MLSRWAETAEDAAEDARRKAEKEEKRRLKAEKQKAVDAQRAKAQQQNGHQDDRDTAERPAKRRRLSEGTSKDTAPQAERTLLRFNTPGWQPCRSIERFDLLNHIEEGSYGFVSRAKEEATGEIVAVKKLKLDPARDGGFPVTALREIQCLNAAKHRHIVDLREVVTGEGAAKEDVYLVMEFVEHDLKTLQEDMDEPFVPSEVKTLILQLGSAVEFLHDHWILHRDLKTSNTLMNNRGEIKIADFGMARYCGDPPPNNLTQLVVTLWYRSTELLLGATTYDSAVDMWSLGCIFGELLTKQPLLQGKNEVDQLSKIFELCGIPNEDIWPGFKRLPNARTLRLPTQSKAAQGSIIRSKFPTLTNAGASLLNSLLSLNPAERPSAKQMLEHAYFREDPRPKPTAMFPTFPSKAGQEKRRRQVTPNAPVRGGAAPALGEIDYSSIFKGREAEEKGVSRGGRGGSRGGGGGMKRNDIPFDIDPELSETADRGEVGGGGKADCAKKIWPPFGEMIFPAPITDDERAMVAIERTMNAQRRAGPFWTGSKEQWASYDAQNNSPVDGVFNPFENVATYGRKNLKRPWRPADLSRIKLDTRFFPKELHAFIDKDDGTDEDGNPIKRQKKLGLVKKSVLDKLAKFDEEGNEDAEPVAEDDESVKSDKDEEGEDFDRDPGDTNYEDEEDEFGGGDYNAEQYFDGGDEDFDEGGADEYADDG